MAVLRGKSAGLRQGFVALAILAAAGCGRAEPQAGETASTPESGEREVAFQRWRDACPSDTREQQNAVAQRALAGDLDAIECQILYFEADTLPQSASERARELESYGFALTDPETFKSALLELYYVRHLMTGEGRDALERLARSMPKDDVAYAMILTPTYAGAPPLVMDDCGWISEEDPRNEIIMLGQGELDIAPCGGQAD